MDEHRSIVSHSPQKLSLIEDDTARLNHSGSQKQQIRAQTTKPIMLVPLKKFIPKSFVMPRPKTDLKSLLHHNGIKPTPKVGTFLFKQSNLHRSPTSKMSLAVN